MKINNKLLLLLLTISFTTIFYSCNEKRGELKRIWFKGSYNRDFNDLNDLHLSSALKIGIEPVSSREEAEHASRKMEEITTNDYYEVEELTHSIPFLVPEAAELLLDLGHPHRPPGPDQLQVRQQPLQYAAPPLADVDVQGSDLPRAPVGGA